MVTTVKTSNLTTEFRRHELADAHFTSRHHDKGNRKCKLTDIFKCPKTKSYTKALRKWERVGTVAYIERLLLGVL
jgi:hypothetical protein